MAERTEYAPGAPCWAGVRTPNVEEAVGFYSHLFGWEAWPPAPNGYVVMTLGGKPVAGVGPLLDPSDEPRWCTYVNVSDADATAEAALAAGASVLIAPFDVPDISRVGVLADPGGAELWIWQPYGFIGAGVVDEPGATCWRELATPDVPAARRFYRATFGWEATVGEDDDSATVLLNGAAVGVLLDAPRSRGVASGWTVSIAVEDAPNTAAKARQLGGERTAPESGRDRPLLLRDPHGAAFAVTGHPSRRPQSRL